MCVFAAPCSANPFENTKSSSQSMMGWGTNETVAAPKQQAENEKVAGVFVFIVFWLCCMAHVLRVSDCEVGEH